MTVLRIPLLDTPTSADAAMLQGADCASANLLIVWIIEATSPILQLQDSLVLLSAKLRL